MHGTATGVLFFSPMIDSGVRLTNCIIAQMIWEKTH